MIDFGPPPKIWTPSKPAIIRPADNIVLARRMPSKATFPQPVFSPVLVAAPAGDKLLDTYPNATVAYSFRKLRDAYTGSAVRIREDGGDTETDIGFDGNGDFDTAAAASHIGANNGFIVTIYDQSGSGNDLTQATAANQPAYSASAGPGSLPSMLFDGVNDWLTGSTNPGSSITNFSYMDVTLPQTGGATDALAYSCEASGRILSSYGEIVEAVYGDFGNDTDSTAGGRTAAALASASWFGAPHLKSFYRDTSDNQSIDVDGSVLETEERQADVTGGAGTGGIGAFATVNFGNFKGYISEIVFWPADLAENRTAARNEINNYYSVF